MSSIVLKVQSDNNAMETSDPYGVITKKPPHNKGDIYVLSVQRKLIITIRNTMKLEHTKHS